MIDKLFPSGGVHILAGPSCAGKTRWLFQSIAAWTALSPILGAPPLEQPPSWLYIPAEPTDGGARKLARHYSLDDSPLLEIAALHLNRSQPLQDLLANLPENRYIAIESAVRCLPTGNLNSYADVHSFLEAFSQAAKLKNSTFILTHPTSKTKDGEGYSSVRERLLGSVAWGAFSDNVVLIEPRTPSNESDPSRLLRFSPRSGSSGARYLLKFNDRGELIYEGKVHGDPFEEFFSALPANFRIRVRQVIGWAEASGTSNPEAAKKQAQRWLGAMASDGRIRKAGHGVYVKVKPS